MSSGKTYRAICDENPHAALGRSVAYLMRKQNFESLKFGAWSKILVGQINRKHYFFVLDNQQVVGFAGWALATKDNALEWLNHNKPLAFDDSQEGDSMVINAWAADTGSVNRFILRTLRKAAVGKSIYAKRFYSDGTTRLVNLSSNRFIEKHLQGSLR